MYKIKRTYTMPKVLKTTFDSYEAARNAVRNYLRSILPVNNSFKNNVIPIGDYGFSITKV